MPENENTALPLLRERCAEGPISYRDYIELALYAEGCGYYRRERERVGRSADRDFYTAESLGQVFARLVTTAAEDLLPEGTAARSQFIEIAAEPGRALLDHLPAHPFATSRVIRLGERIEVEGPVVIFANEWLDALPFHRLVFKDGAWRERGVTLQDGKLQETVLDSLSPAVQAACARLPDRADEGYELDWPLAAEDAVRELLAQDWTGLLLLFDYGKPWPDLTENCPRGTARSYYRHQQGDDLLLRPGRQDITCDVCWTPLQERMEAAGCSKVTLESQESFLVQRAARAAESIIQSEAGQFSLDRQTLMELIHPANMGQRFQVLWGLRGFV